METIRDNGLAERLETRGRLKWLDESTISVQAAAKLNLSLAVGAERPDGYHMFESLMTTVTLCDEITIRRGGRGITIQCDDQDVPVDCRNLVYRAASLLAWYGKLCPAIEIDLRKQIPTQAGLGGGSADAAACLIGLNALWGLDLPLSKLEEIASVLGSDVGFFLSGPLAVCTGRGEQVRRLECGWDFWAVVMKPPDRLSTNEVYRYHRVSDPSCFGLAANLARLVATNKPSEVSVHFCNDLEPAAFRANAPLGELRSSLEQVAGSAVRMSGSGTAMFTTFDTHDQATEFVRRVTGLHPELALWLVRNNPW